LISETFQRLKIIQTNSKQKNVTILQSFRKHFVTITSLVRMLLCKNLHHSMKSLCQKTNFFLNTNCSFQFFKNNIILQLFGTARLQRLNRSCNISSFSSYFCSYIWWRNHKSRLSSFKRITEISVFMSDVYEFRTIWEMIWRILEKYFSVDFNKQRE
jgi:hypothetical protein